jgi:TonB-dependent SusC/RagA subfamily outer membrane receptor
MAVLLLLGSAACAHDGILTPGIAPEPATAELAVATAPAPTRYRINCSGSISADVTPLYVGNGVIRDDPAAIAAGDIERIQVLRGSEAAALYGARGANGVVLITTRAGRASAAS